MEFIKKIRENLGFSKYRMSKELGYTKDYNYNRFENAKQNVNLEKLIILWHLSGLSADEFLQMIEAEVLPNND